MLVTAIVNNHRNTLVVDMPRSKMDLDTKLYSIGRELSHDTPISDNPNGNISVKLLSDSDIGTHLIKLFNESYTLNDVNNLVYSITNAPEEIQEAIESNILYDQYSTPDELIEDIKSRTLEA